MPNGRKEPNICPARVGYTACLRHPMPGSAACKHLLIASPDTAINTGRLMLAIIGTVAQAERLPIGLPQIIPASGARPSRNGFRTPYRPQRTGLNLPPGRRRRPWPAYCLPRWHAAAGSLNVVI
jgi:hypothetical protein